MSSLNHRIQVEFKDFMEPNLIKTGHIIPVNGGHCGPFSKTELNLYEIHLTNAGFIVDLQALAPPEANALNLTGDPDEREESSDGSDE